MGYVCGASMGGMGAWELAADAAEGKAPFAAAGPISGALLDFERASVLAGYPLWCFHAANDDYFSVQDCDKTLSRISAACECTGLQARLRYSRYIWAPMTASPP